MCVHQALFLGEKRRKSLARHGEGGRKVEWRDFDGGIVLWPRGWRLKMKEMRES